jgi:hypothetical protein
MSDPLTDRLGRFTPEGAGLDRDAILFAAGRASVRPVRAWKRVSAVLALTQALTLMLLLPWPSPPARPDPVPSAAERVPPEDSWSPERLPGFPGPRWSGQQGNAPPTGKDAYVPDEPPLSPLSAWHAAPVN